MTSAKQPRQRQKLREARPAAGPALSPGPPAWAWFGLLLAAPAVLAALAYRRGPEIGPDDVSFIFRPFWSYLGASLRHGRFPLWDPDIAAGVPFVASLQSQALYPPAALLFAALPFEAAVYVFLFGHLVWAAIGTRQAGVKLGLSARSATAAGALVAAAPLFAASLWHPNLLAAASWLPWTVLAARRVASDERGGVLALSATLAAGILSASPEVTLLGGIAAAWIAGSRARRGEWSPLGRCAMAGAAAVALASAGLIPFAELLAHARREGAVRGLESAWSLGAGDFASFFLPVFDLRFGLRAGSRIGADYLKGSFQHLFDVVYLGTPAVLVASLGLRGAGRKGRLLAGMILGALALSAGGGILSEALEGLHLGALAFRYPVKFLYPVPFALALLAGAGAEELAARERPGRVSAAAALCGVALSGGAILGIRALDRPLDISLLWVGESLIVFAAVLRWVPAGPWRHWAIVLLCAADMLRCGSYVPLDCHPASCGPLFSAARARLGGGRVDGVSGGKAAEPLAGAFYQGGGEQSDCLVGTVLAQYGLPSVRFNGAPWPARTGYLVGRFGATGDGLLGTSLYLRDHPEELPGARPIEDPALGRVWAATLPGAAPRVELRQTARRVDDMAAALAVETPDRARREVLLEAEAPPPSSPGAPYVGPDRATLVSDRGERVDIETASAGGRWLVLADLYYPGWAAAVDGRPAPIRAAYGMLRAVHLGAGRHRVVFEYRPLTFRIGVLISLASLLLLVAGTFLRRPHALPSQTAA